MERRKLTKEDIDKVRHIEGFPIGTDEDIIALSDAPYYTACPNPFIEEFIRETFNENQEGYWHNWTKMFETTFLKKDYFDKIFAKIMHYAPFCEGQRFLANNNTFFVNMIVDEKGKEKCSLGIRFRKKHGVQLLS